MVSFILCVDYALRFVEVVPFFVDHFPRGLIRRRRAIELPLGHLLPKVQLKHFSEVKPISLPAAVVQDIQVALVVLLRFGLFCDEERSSAEFYLGEV